MLPAEYGLGGLDLVLNKAEDFGHRDKEFRVFADENGEFSVDLGERVYHLSCWLLPPLGCFPRRPPAPYLLVYVPRFPDEYYAVETANGRFRIVAKDVGEVPQSKYGLVDIMAEVKAHADGEGRTTVGAIDLRYELQGRPLPNNCMEPTP